MKTTSLLARSAWLAIVGIASVLPAAPAATAPTTAPATQPTVDVAALIRQLGDDDFRVRAQAAHKLKSAGKAALPALQEARKLPDPEVHARVEEIVEELTRPVIVPDPVPQALGPGALSMRMNVGEGVKVVDIQQRGRTIHILENADGIEMKVIGLLEGKQATREYKVKTAAQLQKANPDAYALYLQYCGFQNGVPLGRFLQPGGGNIGVGLRPPPAPAPAVQPRPQDDQKK